MSGFFFEGEGTPFWRIDFNFWSSLRFPAKVSRKYRFLTYRLLSHVCTLCYYQHAHQSGRFVTVGEPTQHCCPRSIVSTGVDSCCGPFYGFWEKHPSWQYGTEYFTVLKILCALPSQPFFCSTLVTTDLFIVSIVLPFPECHIVGIISYIYSLFRFFYCGTIFIT